eukprot:XP_001709715.1 Hypothetical protein GL50803_36932 [Giardia lamblia ATCC 50803]
MVHALRAISQMHRKIQLKRRLTIATNGRVVMVHRLCALHQWTFCCNDGD